MALSQPPKQQPNGSQPKTQAETLAHYQRQVEIARAYKAGRRLSQR
jgi:hypothetical protein